MAPRAAIPKRNSVGPARHRDQAHRKRPDKDHCVCIGGSPVGLEPNVRSRQPTDEKTGRLRNPLEFSIGVGGAKGDRTPDLMTARLGLNRP